MRRPVVALIAVITAAVGVRSVDQPATPFQPPHVSSMRGTLRLSQYGTGTRAARPLVHVTEYVQGPHYTGMEDNDIRGYLDGNFKWGWNQPGQVHVRVGRRGEAARYGEYELFRVLQRWDGITLPEDASVKGARLDVTVELGNDRPVSVMLYAVHKDWNPGLGGELGNNNSPPRQGEVWWNEAAHGVRIWGLPGAGFAAAHPDADTDVMPLAEALYQPGDTVLSFASGRLAAYVTERVRAREPLLLLLKLSDDDEDLPGSCIALFSASSDNELNHGRRPHLVLEWSAPSEQTGSEQEVYLEHGRRFVLPIRIRDGASLHAVTFVAREGYTAPTLLARGGTGPDTSAWRSAALPFEADWQWLEVTALAATNPTTLGQRFTQTIVDTWTPTGPPEQQTVPWVFVSPTGIVHTTAAAYLGQNRWQVSFTPDELGRWTYRWSSHFTPETYHSPEGVFDVIIGDRANARAQLDRFLTQARAAQPVDDSAAMKRLMTRFARLERAALQNETPQSFRSPDGARMRTTLNEIRQVLGGEPVPPADPSAAEARQVSHVPVTDTGFLHRLMERAVHLF